jgi:stearoyl-CoA desaturase (delta-9 desaturase)
MAIILFVIIHWYSSLFFQSFFHHRYTAHAHFSMSRFWEKVCFIACFITQGSSYISAAAYGAMHRMHHAYTDKPEDPHSPHNDPNLFAMLWSTRNNYRNIWLGKTAVDPKYLKDLPRWDSFDKYAHTFYARFIWVGLYIAFYAVFATAWWHWLFLPVTLLMGAFQGAAVNFWAHKWGYENYHMSNTSKNILPVDILFVGEAYHNNHHRHPGRPNNAVRWFEFDVTYGITRVLDKIGVVRINHPNRGRVTATRQEMAEAA